MRAFLKVCAVFGAVLLALICVPAALFLVVVADTEGFSDAPCAARAAGTSNGSDRAPGVPPKYRAAVVEAAETAGLPQAVIGAQIEAESGWDADSVSHAGAVGLAQFMPATWGEYGEGDPRDGEASIRAQGRYMKALMDLAAPHADNPDHHVQLALAAYNWGPGSMEGNGWSLDGLPAETANYVASIPTNGQDWYTKDCTPVTGAGAEYTGPLGDGEWTHPLPESTLTSGYGGRNVPGLPAWAQNHVGLDFATPGGGPVVAPTDLRITNVYDADGCVMAKATTSPDFGFAFCHLDSYSVTVGDEVKRGDTIGQEGTKATSVGTSVARHLHIELYSPDAGDPRYPGPGAEGVMDPTPILKAKGAM